MITIEKQPRRVREKHIQKIIARDSTLLGLGDMTLKAVEKPLINGRLDLQFKGEDAISRYEVELQLGKLDNDHLLRCVHYWNHERRENPQYKHYAVIVAEEIPEYMLEAITLFKAPIIAIKISIDRTNNKITEARQLNDFPKYEWDIIDSNHVEKGKKNKDIPFQPYDMAYIETKWSENSRKALNELHRLAKEVNQDTIMNITKRYIGFTVDDFYSYMFVVSKGDSLIIKPVLDHLPEIDNMIKKPGLKCLGYIIHKNKPAHYNIQINMEDIMDKDKENVIRELIKMAYEKWRNNNRGKT